MANVILLGSAAVGVTVLSRIAQSATDTHLGKQRSIARPLLGGILYVGMLSLIDMGSPTIAAGLAVVVLVTAILLNGVPLLQAISRKVG